MNIVKLFMWKYAPNTKQKTESQQNNTKKHWNCVNHDCRVISKISLHFVKMHQNLVSKSKNVMIMFQKQQDKSVFVFKRDKIVIYIVCVYPWLCRSRSWGYNHEYKCPRVYTCIDNWLFWTIHCKGMMANQKSSNNNPL
jgi:hypothetical protein